MIVEGSVNAFREALVHLVVLGPEGLAHEVEAVVDTGYTGALTLPSDLIAGLNLPFRSRGRALLADGRETVFDSHEATIKWGGATRRILVDAAAAEPLLGMALLHGHELTIEVLDGGRVLIRELPLSPA